VQYSYADYALFKMVTFKLQSYFLANCTVTQASMS